ncbi:MltR family transcriptional regulator [Vibrio sp. Isolate31]|uniref:MltR family transcriptional regulator n=1 Tax=unclassified Vibrio TaxID=2614977 RepID=UPI001EFDD428|nr:MULTISPECIES: MltR family transcriptional regulator [unclassified Vibrio]MCG9555111.1 MltR family transcriptional regulator [Vibrio sp. Isolate32]MCG9602115.1 MltR family transcriptional regulator [Vibrio sp. Isolate31]
MPIHTTHESELLEELAESANAAECLLCAYDVLEDMLDALLKSIFYKDDYAVKFVVDPLLTTDGPLGEILVRTKLLLGLGVISKEVYDDIEVFVTLKEWVNIQEGKVNFWDQDVVFELNRINAIQKMMPIDYAPKLVEGMSDDMKRMFLERHFQKVRSTIVLAVNDIHQQLAKENVLTS